MEKKDELSAIWKFIYDNMMEDREISSTAIGLWFGNFDLRDLSAEKAVFAVDQVAKVDVIKNRYTDYLRDHLERVIGFAPPEIEIYVDDSLRGDPPVGEGTIISPLRKMRENIARRQAEEEKRAADSRTGNDDDLYDDEEEFDNEERLELLRRGTDRDRLYRPAYRSIDRSIDRSVGDDDDEDEDEDLFLESRAMELEAENIKLKSENRAAAERDDPSEVLRGTGERRLYLNTDYTFENFIVGSSNSFAHAAALSVANSPGIQYNPLFLYGNSGLGKTHLMYAIANKALERDPYMKVIYVKGEEFMNQLIDALRIKKNMVYEFRQKYRKADMLLIDDIQIIAGKDSTQMEFFHTFDALYEDHKQIIITSDKPPQEIENLDERIRNRFENGLLADIKPPDYELRLAILKEKSKRNGLDIPPEVLSFLAEKLQSNVRQIEGVIKKLGANHFLTGAPITMEMVRSSVPEFIRESDSLDDFVSKIILCVAERYKTTSEDILGPKRNKEIKNARNMAMYLVRSLTGLSLPKIGSVFNRDYSTVHSNLSYFEKQVLCDAILEAEVRNLEKEIKKR